MPNAYVPYQPLPGTTGVVTGATNASPIEITTQTAHGLNTGALAYLDGVLGNTAANGLWIITKTSATKFTLNGSTGNGAWSSGGQVYTPVFHGPVSTVQFPVDGEPRTMTTAAVPQEVALDNTAWLYSRLFQLLPNGGSSPFFIANIDSNIDGTFTSPVLTLATFATLYNNVTVTADARIGDFAVTFVSCVMLTGASGGSSNGGTLKLQDTQNGGAAADLGLTVGAAPRAANAEVPMFLVGLRSITVAGAYTVNLEGLVQFVGSSQTIAISDVGNSVGGGIQAITFILRAAPNP